MSSRPAGCLEGFMSWTWFAVDEAILMRVLYYYLFNLSKDLFADEAQF